MGMNFSIGLVEHDTVHSIQYIVWLCMFRTDIWLVFCNRDGHMDLYCISRAYVRCGYCEDPHVHRPNWWKLNVPHLYRCHSNVPPRLAEIQTMTSSSRCDNTNAKHSEWQRQCPTWRLTTTIFSVARRCVIRWCGDPFVERRSQGSYAVEQQTGAVLRYAGEESGWDNSEWHSRRARVRRRSKPCRARYSRAIW